LKVKKLELGFLKVNCYILSLNSINVIIDPGADFKIIKENLTRYGIKPDFILNTHGHYDHIGAVNEMIGYYKIPFYIHELEEPIIRDPYKNLSSFFGGNELLLKTYKLIKNNDYGYFEGLGINIINVPGHTPGSIMLNVDGVLFTGDFIFKDSIGRTDLPGGDLIQIKKSLSVLKKMDRSYLIYPGHGENTTLEQELKTNCFLDESFLSDDSKIIREKGDLF